MQAMDDFVDAMGEELPAQALTPRKRVRKAKGQGGTTQTANGGETSAVAMVPGEERALSETTARGRHRWTGRLLDDADGPGGGTAEANEGATVDAPQAYPGAAPDTGQVENFALGAATLSPALRRHAPVPVVPWHTRAQRHLKELTQPGRIESETDGVIAGLLSRPALTDGCKTVAVLGAKGGAGKSTTSLALGLLLGTFDAAKPVVMEVNPDLGNVRQLLPEPNPRTVQDLLEGLVAAERGGVNRVQGYLTMWGRLGVLTAPQRPDEMARLSPRDYARALRLLKLYFGTVILDCGTSFTNRLQQWAIQTADHLVLVTQPEEAPLLTTLAAIDYLASTAYAEDYRGVFREVADAAGPEWAGARGSRARCDMTLVVNGVGFAGRRDPVDPDKIRAAAAGLNAVIDVPYSAELRRRINDGVLTPEVLPTPYRRAIKGGLAAVLGRLAEG
jgi:MinD-like ATPase involved in chromosome partitioning or flagellar assembly